MLKDIRNVMSLKRANSTSDCLRAKLLNLSSGKKYAVPEKEDEEFVFGRSLSSSIVIEHPCVSRRHCVIRFENNQYTIFDNDTFSGTYINCVKMAKGKDNSQVLKNGDVIGFGEINHFHLMFKFILAQTSDKRIRLIADKNDKENTTKVVPQNAELHKKYNNLHSEIRNLHFQNLVLKNNFRRQTVEIQKTINSLMDIFKQLKTEMKKQIDVVQDLTQKNSEINSALLLQQECLPQKYIEPFKSEVFSIIENDLQCPICNEVLLKVRIINCSHTFCDVCLTTWMIKSKKCPVCRNQIKSVYNCLTIDNFLTNMCDFLGGAIKEQRDNLKTERLNTSKEAGKKRKRVNELNRSVTIVLPTIDVIDEPLQRRPTRTINAPIELVDLTQNTSR